MKTGEIIERDDRMTLDFEDPEGQRLSLIDDGGKGDAYPWEKSPVPAAQQIRGLGPITLSVPNLKSTDAVLTTLMGMREVRTYPHPENATRHGARLRDGRRRRAARSCTSRCSRTCGRRSRARAACITWRSARRTPSTTAGPSG